MKRYDERLLHLLLDRYENSLLYEEKNRVNITITVPINKQTFPEYFDVTSLAYDTIHEQFYELESKGYIVLEWGKKKKHILEKCVLNLSKVDEIYRVLSRLPKLEKAKKQLSLLKKYQSQYTSEICQIFLHWLLERLEKGESIKEYCNMEKPQQLEPTLKLLAAIENNQQEIFLRQLSIAVFHDSKVAEGEIKKVIGIMRRFGDTSFAEDISNLSEEEILAEYQIFRNPSWVMCKGYGAMWIGTEGEEDGKTYVNLKNLPGGLGISNEDIEKIVWDTTIRPDYVITIENLTSFHTWKTEGKEQGKGLCLYLGGFANTPRKHMLRKLYQAYNQSLFYHFGDMDAGGFLIWKNLCQATHIPFQPIGMGMETYENYKHLGRPLTEHDKKQLQNMMEDPFFISQKDVLECMLLQALKIEQECVVPEL